MAGNFADGFDCYTTAPTDLLTYWDTATGTVGAFPAGRFSGSRGVSFSTSATPALVKANGATDAAHHIVVAINQGAAITGTNLGAFFQLRDGATAQCSVVFRSDGAILLTSGAHTGTVLATYSGAVTAASTWFAFEIEVFISATAGYMNVRKNGNSANDFTSATNLVTRGGTANPYANTLAVGQAANTSHVIDDLYWRSDASSVAWMGDMKCITRYPASDASVQFSRTLPVYSPDTGTSSQVATGNNQARYTSFVSQGGTIGAVTLTTNATGTINVKCAIFADNGSGQPGTLIQGATAAISNPPIGANVFTFSPAVSIAVGTRFWVGVIPDAIVANFWITASSGTTGWAGTGVVYSVFPQSNPVGLAALAALNVVPSVSGASNAGAVNEAQQDATTSYVYSSTPGHADLYGIAAIASTPLTTFAVTTRAYAIKSDAGTRTMAVQLKSGASTVASPTVVLTPSNWQWAWQHYPLDPATGAAWTAAAVNTALIGPAVIS
jgi:hypothetical protein